MKNIHFIISLSLVLVFFAVCSKRTIEPLPSGNGGVAMKVGSELTGATVQINASGQASPSAETDIQAGDTIVVFENLEPGVYYVNVEMPDGRKFTTEVVVTDGNIWDLGTISKIDSSDIGLTRPDPMVVYPEFIAWHYPSPNEKVIFDATIEPYPMPMMESGGSDAAPGMPYVRVLGITFQFTKPMNKERIQSAFHIFPGSAGTFSWNYYAPFMRGNEDEPYVLATERSVLTEKDNTGNENSGSGTMPVPMPDQEISDTSMIYGFTYFVNENELVMDTVYEVVIDSTAKDSLNRTIGETYRFRFFTGSSPSPYPFLSIKPSAPVSSNPVDLQIVLGMSQSACDPEYTVSFSRSGSNLYLSYIEILSDMACIMIATEPHPYGPVFHVENLSEGEYNVYTADSVFIGAFSVQEPRTLTGMVLQMEDPAIVHIRAPVLAGAAIVAESNSGCGYNYMPVSGESDRVTAVSDANGRFTLSLAPGYLTYKITAEKAGFYTQVAFWNAYDTVNQISFELIDTAQTPLADISITVLKNGVPAESAWVYVNAGNLYSICPMADQMEMAVSGPATGNSGTNHIAEEVSLSYSGRTNSSGKLTLSDIALVPFIEFTCAAYDPEGAYAYGIVRLNAFVENDLVLSLVENIAVSDSLIIPEPMVNYAR